MKIIYERKETIPIGKLLKNKHFLTILPSTGGHIEYPNGFNQEWWGFSLALDYFSYFQAKLIS